MADNPTLLGRISAAIDGLVDRVAIVLFVVIFAAVLAQIVMRYMFDDPLIWSEELSRYLFIWIALLGWTLASRNHTHITVRLFVDMLPRRVRPLAEAANAFLVLAFAGVLFWLGIELVVVSTDVPTITLFFNFAVIYAAVPVTAAVIVLHCVRDIVAHLRDLSNSPVAGNGS